MTTDPLDDLLDRSAPSVVDRGATTDKVFRQMIREAHDDVGSPRPRRRTMAGVAAVLGGLLVASGGMAVAAGLVMWPAGFENPDADFTFALPSGRACEVRLVEGAIPGGDVSVEPEQLAVKTDFFQWLRDGDFQSKLNLDTAQVEADRILVEQESQGVTVLIGADGWLIDAPVTVRHATEDDAYAFAVDRAITMAMNDYLEQRGVPENMRAFGAGGGVKCAD